MRQFIIQLNRFFMILAGAALIIMTLQIGLLALTRYFFNTAFDGNIEIVKFYYMVALAALPLGAVQASKEHIIVEVFTQWMSATSRAVLDWFALVFMTAYSVILAYGCLLSAIEEFKSKEIVRLYSYDLIIWPSRWVLAIGLIILLMTCFYMIFTRKDKL